MPSLLLEGENGDVLDLDYVQKHGRGIQVTAGVTGFGLPPIQTRWIEGAGNGATFRGRRVLPRDVDLLLTILGDDHADLQNLLNRLARLLEGKVRLRMLEDTGQEWWLDTYWVGGGDYAYGVNGQGETDADLLITLRSGDPFWTSETTQQKIISSRGTAAPAGAARSTPSTGVVPFLDNLGGLAVAPSQASGEITLENAGDAESHPIWEVRGPGENFEAVAPNGDVFRWVGVLGPDDVLTIDTATGLVTDQNGVNRYAELDEAPRLWTIPAGTNTGTASLSNTSTGTWVADGGPLVTNLIPNPSFEVDTAGWVTGAGIEAITKSSFGNGVKHGSFGVGVKGTSPAQASNFNYLLPPDAPTAPGKWLVAVVPVRQSTGGLGANLTVQCRNATNGIVQSSPSKYYPLSSFGIKDTEPLVVVMQAPAGTTKARPVLWFSSASGGVPPDGWSAHTDAWLFAEASTEEEARAIGRAAYFDGSSEDGPDGFFDWTGTPHNSPSTKRASRLSGASRIAVSWRARKWLMV